MYAQPHLQWYWLVCAIAVLKIARSSSNVTTANCTEWLHSKPIVRTGTTWVDVLKSQDIHYATILPGCQDKSVWQKDMYGWLSKSTSAIMANGFEYAMTWKYNGTRGCGHFLADVRVTILVYTQPAGRSLTWNVKYHDPYFSADAVSAALQVDVVFMERAEKGATDFRVLAQTHLLHGDGHHVLLASSDQQRATVETSASPRAQLSHALLATGLATVTAQANGETYQTAILAGTLAASGLIWPTMGSQSTGLARVGWDKIARPPTATVPAATRQLGLLLKSLGHIVNLVQLAEYVILWSQGKSESPAPAPPSCTRRRACPVYKPPCRKIFYEPVFSRDVMQYSTATPSLVKNWRMEMKGWQPKSVIYRLDAGVGSNIDYALVFLHGGHYKGVGQYLSMIRVLPIVVNPQRYWSATIKVQVVTPVNRGTADRPIAYIEIDVVFTLSRQSSDCKSKGFEEVKVYTNTHSLIGDGETQLVSGNAKCIGIRNQDGDTSEKCE